MGNIFYLMTLSVMCLSAERDRTKTSQAEQDRLDLQHHVYTLALDGWPALAPMTEVPGHVLDIATGTGIWALEYGNVSNHMRSASISSLIMVCS